jgi:hypothetical protein
MLVWCPLWGMAGLVTGMCCLSRDSALGDGADGRRGDPAGAIFTPGTQLAGLASGAISNAVS